MMFADQPQAAQMAIRCTIAAAAGAAVSQALKLDFPVFAMLAAIISTDLTPRQGRILGVRRLYATVIGALSGILLSAVLPPAAWSAGLGILCTMFVAQLLNVRTGAKVASFVCAIIILQYGHQSSYYAFYRFVETALGVLIAWLLVFVPLLVPNAEIIDRRRAEGERSVHWSRVDEEPTAPWKYVLIQDVQLTLRTAVAATAAMLIAQVSGLQYPIFAGISAVIVTDLLPAGSRALGASRVVATIIGAGCAGMMGMVPDASPAWIGAGILISMLACQFLGFTEAAKLAACVCCIVMVMHGGQPLKFAFERMVETGIGVIVAVAVSYLPKLINLENSLPGSASDVS